MTINVDIYVHDFDNTTADISIAIEDVATWENMISPNIDHVCYFTCPYMRYKPDVLTVTFPLASLYWNNLVLLHGSGFQKLYIRAVNKFIIM